MTRLGRLAIWALAAAAVAYLALLTALYANQRSFIYPGWAHPSAPRAPLDPTYHVVSFRTTDGLHLRAFYRPPASGKPVILFFHGNGGSITSGEEALTPLATAGYGIFLPEYRGYGGNPGTPSEAGLYRDGRGAVAWLKTRGVGAEHIVVIGYSLGSGVATQIASEIRPRALILIAGLASMPKVVSAKLPYVPAALHVTERFDNMSKIRGIQCPILLIHGLADRTVPVDNSLALKGVRPDVPLRLIRGADHDVIFLPVTGPIVLDWLSQTLNARSGVEGAHRHAIQAP